MSQHGEIERKFLVKKRPPGWARQKSVSIAQGYLSLSVREVETRLRRKDSKHFLTIKVGRGERRREEEIEIPDTLFNLLWTFTRGMRISNPRYLIPCADLTVEMDVYQGGHRELVTAEIEFKTQKASRHWELPEWFGHEITGRREYKIWRSHRARSYPAN